MTYVAGSVGESNTVIISNANNYLIISYRCMYKNQRVAKLLWEAKYSRFMVASLLVSVVSSQGVGVDHD